MKPNKLNQNEIIAVDDKCIITGINEHSTETLGSMTIDLHVTNDLIVFHKFQIVNQEFPIPTDGILGRDFLSKYHC